MLRVNLLPDYYKDKNKIRNLGLVWTVIIIGLTMFMLMMNSQASQRKEAAEKLKADNEALKATTDGLKTKIATEKSDRQKTEAKQVFVKASQEYNNGWPEVFETVRDVRPTGSSIILNTMSLDTTGHKTMTVTGFGSEEKELVRWWISLRNNTALIDHVNFDLVPHVFAPPTSAAGGGGGAQPPGSGGAPGRQTLTAMGASSTSTFGSGPSSGGAPRMGGGGAGGGGSDKNGPTVLQGKPGLNFTATIVLKNALAGGIPTPSWPLGGDAGGGGGGGGMPPMGGSGGPMGGSGGPMSSGGK